MADRAPRIRMSAGERRAEIVAVARRHFAQQGYNAASTEAIAKEAGISQPYLFRLFGTKRDLFLACSDANHERIEATFRAAAEGVPREERLHAMGKAYVELLGDRDALLGQMQGYAATADPVIQAHMRERYRRLVELVGELADAGPEQLWTFFATGMLLNVVAALDLEALAGESEWASAWSRPGELLGA